jgi:hypothetical protein
MEVATAAVSHPILFFQKAYKDLEEYGDTTLPIHALKEGEFVVIEK